MLALAALGSVSLLVRDRRSLAAIVAMAAPYLAFHLLFQDTSFTRYAVPLVPGRRLAGGKGVAWVAARAVLPAGAALALVAVSRRHADADRICPMPRAGRPGRRGNDAEAARDAPGALAMHQTFQRPLEAELVGVHPQLPSPPRREWLELAKYWTQGHDAPMWFLADPRRSDLALVDPRSRHEVTAFRWGPAASPTFGGMRPAALDWVRIGRPGWFAEEGWALTPETAGMARLMGRGPHLGPITRTCSADAGARRVLVGRPQPRGSRRSRRSIHARRGRRAWSQSWDVAPGFFLRTVDLPGGSPRRRWPVRGAHDPVAPVSGEAPIPTAIEQFDLQRPASDDVGIRRGLARGRVLAGAGRLALDQRARRHSPRRRGDAAARHIAIRAARALFRRSERRVASAPARSEVATGSVSNENTLTFDVPLDAIVASDGRIVDRDTQTFVPGGARMARRIVAVSGCACSKCAWIASVCVDTARSEPYSHSTWFDRHCRSLHWRSYCRSARPPAARRPRRSRRRHRRRHPPLRHHRHRPRPRHHHHHRRRRRQRSPKSRSSRGRRWIS